MEMVVGPSAMDMADDVAASDTPPMAEVLTRDGLKEPTADTLESFTDLTSVLRWAKNDGDPWVAH